MTKPYSTKSPKATKAMPKVRPPGAGAAGPSGNGHDTRIQEAPQGDRFREIVGTAFQNDSTVRAVLASNLKERSAAATAFRSRAQQAFASFNPTRDRSGPIPPNYVTPGESVTTTQHDVITKGIDAFRNSTAPRSMKLLNSPELKKLIQKPPANGESIIGTIPLADLMSYIEGKSETGSFFAQDGVMTVCKAENEADRRLQRILHSQDKPPAPVVAPSAQGANGSHPDMSHLVKDNVDLQMATATSPESPLRYAVAATREQVAAIHSNVDTFELRSGPSDVTAFHDFQNLQIAFEDVWIELFDSQLADLGRQLYEEYVRLKFAAGSDDQQDLPINTIDDLRQLMDEIRDFSRLTADSIPPAFQPPPDPYGGSRRDNTGNVVDKVVEAVINPIGAAAEFLNQAFHSEGVLTWDSFKASLPLGDQIELTTNAPLPPPDDVPPGFVKIALERGTTQIGPKNLAFHFRGNLIQIIQVNDNHPSPFMLLPSDHMKDGALEFGKNTGIEVHGVYVLGGLDEVLKGGTSVTFTWTFET